MAPPPRTQVPQLFREPVFLVDLATYKPPDELRIDTEACSDAAWAWKHPDGRPVSQETHEFVKNVFVRSGIDKKGSYLPANLHPQHTADPRGGLDESFAEARLIMGGVVSELLEKNNLKASDIDILVTSSSIFCPTPSLSSMLINQLKFREDVMAYSLGGMGCANGVVGLTLLRSMLQAHPGAKAIFVTSEICSSAFYQGENKHCLVSNALFRMGGAAALLTSGRAQRRRAKYELLKAERSHQGASDASYGCMYVGPDEVGLPGIFLYKDLPQEAGRALTTAIKKLTPQILPWDQYLSAALTVLKAKIWGKEAVPRFVPDFTRVADHFLIHAGGYAVLVGIMKSMGLPVSAMLPSFSNLKDYGNTSSATTWYSWTYLESTTGVKRGETVLQLGVGGGMKAAVVYWRAVRDVRETHRAWAHVAGRPYCEADLPRPITVAGTLTGLKDDGRPTVAAAAAAGGGGKAAAAAAAAPPADGIVSVSLGKAGGGGGKAPVAAAVPEEAAAARSPTAAPATPDLEPARAAVAAL